ncbi:hypothetical protein D3C78_1730460 [compost metagenome]
MLPNRAADNPKTVPPWTWASTVLGDTTWPQSTTVTTRSVVTLPSASTLASTTWAA